MCQWIDAIPKAEIHVHLEGSIYPEILWRIVQRKGHNTDIRKLDDALARYRFDVPNDFFRRFLEISGYVRALEDIVDIVADAGRRLVDQNCLYVEWTFAPQKFVRDGLPYPALLDAIQAGLGRLNGALQAKIIIDLVRNLGHDESLKTMQLLRAHPHPLVTGIGLGGTEDYKPHLFVKAFEQARDLGLGVTAHAGESGGPESIWETLRNLNVNRIDHGVRALEDPKLVSALVEREVVLNMCPSSNFRLGIVQKPSAYPLRHFLDKGLHVTIGSDDPPFFDTTLTKELKLAVSRLGMRPNELIAAQRQAIASAFLTKLERQNLSARFESQLGVIYKESNPFC